MAAQTKKKAAFPVIFPEPPTQSARAEADTQNQLSFGVFFLVAHAAAASTPRSHKMQKNEEKRDEFTKKTPLEQRIRPLFINSQPFFACKIGEFHIWVKSYLAAWLVVR